MKKLLLALALLAPITAAAQTLVPTGGGSSTPCTTTALSLQYNAAGAFGCVSGWATNGSTALVGGAGTTLTVGAGTAITSSGPGGALTSLAYTTPGTGVVSALGVNVGSAGAFITFNGAGGTPSSMVGTNITGTAAGLTAGNVTTNANLTGDVTSVGNAATLASSISGAKAFTTSFAVGGCIISTNALCVTGTVNLAGTTTVSSGGIVTTTAQGIGFANFNTSIYSRTANAITAFMSSSDQAEFSSSGLQLKSTMALLWSGGNIGAASDLILSHSGAATLQFGASDAAVAVAQTTRVQSVVAGTAAANGANWTLIGSLPTGTGTSGDVIFQTGVKTGSGTTQGTATTALTIKGETQALVTAALDASGSTGGALQVAGGASVAKRFWIPAITTSAGLQTAVLCQSSGGEMIADSVACLASGSQFKTILGPMEDGALGKLMKLPMDRWAYKAEGNFKSDDWTRERIGPIAQDVAAMDKRLAGYDNEGNIRTFSTEQLLAFTIKAVQELNAKVEAQH